MYMSEATVKWARDSPIELGDSQIELGNFPRIAQRMWVEQSK